MFLENNNTNQDKRAIKRIVLNTLISEKDLLAAVYGHNKIDGYTIETNKLTNKDNDYEISVRKSEYENPFIRISFEMIKIDCYEATIQIDLIELQSQHSISMKDGFELITDRLNLILINVIATNPTNVSYLPISYITVQDEIDVNLDNISLLDLLFRFKLDHLQPEINESKDTFSFLDLNNSSRTLLSINLNELNPKKTEENGTTKEVIEYYFYSNQFKIAAEKVMSDNFCDVCHRGMEGDCDYVEVEYMELDEFNDLKVFDIQKAIEELYMPQLLQEGYASSRISLNKRLLDSNREIYYNYRNREDID